MKMSTAIVLTKLSCGGPGSGPHTGSGSGHEEAHQHLTNNGFRLAKSKNGVAEYSHSDLGRVSLHPQGAWTHSPKGRGAKSGTGVGALKEHLNKVADAAEKRWVSRR